MIELANPVDIRPEFQVSELRSFLTSHGETYAVVCHNPSLSLISDFWFGSYQSDDNFRQVMTFLRDQFEANRYRRWLADLRFMTLSFADHGDWLVEEIMPAVMASGLDREAVVVSDVMGLPSRQDVSSAAAASLGRLASPKVRSFTDVDEAKRWLLED